MIRPARPADVPAILGLIRELAAFEHLEAQCVATEEALATHLFGPDRAAEAMVAEAPVGGGGVVGYAIYFKTFSTFLAKPGIYLEDVYVQPAHRGQGIGTAFLKALAMLAVQRGYGRVEWSVLDWNAPAIGFYRSLGAEPLTEWRMMRLTGDGLVKLGA